ncbi:hypothetical protein UFOVP1655_60 [uncultured Caudovirales phage]|uniref:Uncharacterized protein n=1 Tax=uncultured Caudovirales phage TaxID=2100421 RepID=A0A6J5T3K6_9CAUD|nr:hypothetical protein UFOVP1655_60 [uncultured Caudovirales phage]
MDYIELKDDSMLLHYVASILELDRPQISKSMREIADKLENLSTIVKDDKWMLQK